MLIRQSGLTVHVRISNVYPAIWIPSPLFPVSADMRSVGEDLPARAGGCVSEVAALVQTVGRFTLSVDSISTPLCARVIS
jgi:hypothetical protein